MRRIKRRHRHPPTNRNRPPKQEDNDEEEEEHDQKPYILQLPVCIITEIFCKIPTKTLIQCKRVCKTWRCWFSDPQFTRELFSRTPASLWVTGHFLVDLDRIGSQSDVALELFGNLRPLCMTVVGSCNGFLCHYDFNSDFTSHLLISNPVSREFLSLPIHSIGENGDCYGFGFSPISDVYKLVQVTSLGGEPDQVMVLTIGSGIWRNIGHPGYSFYRVKPRHGIYLNGVLHWIGRSCRDRSRRLVCAFDVESERFQELPLPLSSDALRRTYFKLGVLKGWLSVIHKVNDVISVWVMKDYGVKESWTKELEFKEPVGSFVTSILKFTDQGQVLGLHDNQLMAYTLATTNLVRVKVDGLPSRISEAWELVPSFVLLKDIAGGLQLEGTICQSFLLLLQRALLAPLLRPSPSPYRNDTASTMKKTKLCCRNRAPNDEEGEEEHDQKPYILQLPDHLMVQIFCKITTKTLIQCKRVCKSWRCWLADPQFTRDLLSRTPASLLVSGFRTPTSKDTGHFFIDLDRASTLNRASSDVVLKLFSIKPNVQSSRGIHIVGSCNGFLCHELLSEVSNQLYISNPVTGESLTLPEPTNPCRTSPGKYGFGFSPISNVYKVVRLMSPIKGSEEQAMVLNVGSGIWRDIGGSVNSFGITDDGIYLKGFLHWIGRRRSEGSLLICAFDIESEHFRELPLPPCSLDLKKTRVKLGVLKGWLCLIISSRVKINVWVMKDYGVKESWTKEHEIRDPLGCFGTEILKFTGKGKVLVLHLSHLHAYTPATMGLVWVEVDELPAMVVEAWDLIPSFVSLKDITKGLELPAGVSQTM